MKRGRVDVGVSKEQYEASQAAGDSVAVLAGASASALSAVGGFPRAPEKVLQARKILTKVGSVTRSEEARRQYAALNRALVAGLKAQWSHNKAGGWEENMREYVAYAREIDGKFGGHRGQVCSQSATDLVVVWCTDLPIAADVR